MQLITLIEKHLKFFKFNRDSVHHCTEMLLLLPATVDDADDDDENNDGDEVATWFTEIICAGTGGEQHRFDC